MEELGYGNILQNCIENLLLAEKELQDNASHGKEHAFTSLDQFWKQIDIIAKKLSFECTKLCISFTSSPQPTSQETSGLLQGIEQAVIALVSTVLKFNQSFGKALYNLVFAASVNAIQSVRQLIRLIKDSGSTEINARYHHATGVAWEGCKAIEKCPKNDRDAVLSNLKELSLLVTDAFNEINDALEGDGKGWSNIGISGSDSDSEDEPTWSEQDKLTVNPTVNIIKAAKILYTKLVVAIEKNGSCDSLENIAQLDQLLEDCKSASITVDTLILEIYPPLNVANMDLQSHTLASHLLTALKTAAKSHVITEDERSAFEFIQKAVDHNLNKMKEVLKNL